MESLNNFSHQRQYLLSAPWFHSKSDEKVENRMQNYINYILDGKCFRMSYSENCNKNFKNLI